MDERERTDEGFLREAIALAVANVHAGTGGPFGALVVRGGEVIGRGTNRVTSSHDPTAHAEVVAIREACARLGTHTLAGAVLYASCEPCPMCLAAAHWARIERLCFAAGREDAAAAGFDDELLYRELQLPPGERTVPARQVLRAEGQEPFAVWRESPLSIPY